LVRLWTTSAIHSLAGVSALALWLSAGSAFAQAKAPKGKAPVAEPAPEAPPPPPPGPSPEMEAQAARIAALEESLRQQSEAMRAMRSELESRLREEQTGRQSADAALTGQLATSTKKAEELPPTVTSARPGLSLTGFIQADLGVRQSSEDEINGSTGDPLNENRFSIRRARLRATMEDTYVSGALEFDGNTLRGATARIIGAEASLKWPGETPADPPLAMGTMGLFKIPFGFEVLQSDRDRLFVERSTVIRALFPGEYDVGARLSGGWRFLRYVLAVQNGDPLGEKAFPGRDPNQAKDITGRLGLDTAVVPAIVSVSGGVSATWGKGLHKGTPATKTTFAWQDRDENGRLAPGEIVTIPGVSATPSATFTRHAVGLDARVAFALRPAWQTTLYGELIWANNLDRAILVADPLGPLGRAARELGYYAALTQDVGAHASIGVRYDFYDPDRDSTSRQLARTVPTKFSYQTVAIAAALRARSGRLVVEYDVNRNHLGRDSAGFAANLKDNALTVRAEARF
jgi:hypothetical protein